MTRCFKTEPMASLADFIILSHNPTKLGEEETKKAYSIFWSAAF